MFILVTRKIILCLDDVVQVIFIPRVIKSKLFPELNLKGKITTVEGYLASKISLKIILEILIAGTVAK